ncbi:MAG TPA: tRNA pseudouridine(38-40) synthase TruA [Chloroflexota bacterium]|nr:tRNA pseudouridine(38-40) synthase TruA [Chloroflexota bacterium]
MRTIRLTVAYDGTDFAGFQYQTGQRTVQEVLEAAIARVTGTPTRIQGAGRTDAGVHATGQVVSFTTENCLAPPDLGRALNGVLPEDVAVKSAHDAAPGFHARYAAVGRGYRYTIWNSVSPLIQGRRYAFQWRRFLDLPAMNRVAAVLVGRHDFAAYGGSLRGRQRPTTTVRTLFRLHCWRDAERVYVDAAANAFLPRMVRNLVGTLLQAGLGQITAAEARATLESRERSATALTVPPVGLCLTRVWYD